MVRKRGETVFEERGIALLLAIIVTVIISLLGLSMTFNATGDYMLSSEFENHERALLVADGGFDMARNQLRGTDLTELLRRVTEVPVYHDFGVAEPGTYAYRNPLHPNEARHANFHTLTPSGSRMAKGFLTPGVGAMIGTGRYFAKVTDNRDEEAAGLGVDDPETDIDETVYVRVMGVHPNNPFDLPSYDGRVKNSVAIIEGLLRRDLSFNMGAPFTVYGPNLSSTFEGNSFTIDGYDHSGMTIPQIQQGHQHGGLTPYPGLTGLYDDPDGGDAQASLETIYGSLTRNQRNNIVGSPGPYGQHPSLVDGTQAVRESDNPDAANVFDPAFLMHFVNTISSVADFHYAEDVVLDGNNVSLGTEDDPKITVAHGDLRIAGNGGGSGVLIVKGRLEYEGAFNYNGLILVVGEGEVAFGGANKSLIGGLYVARVTENGDGEYEFEPPTIEVAGNTNFYYRSSSVRMGLSLFPMKTLVWREITPEIEPPAGY